MASVINALDTITSVLNNATYLTDPYPTARDFWWHDTPPDPRLTFPRGYIYLVSDSQEKLNIGRPYCSKHTVMIGIRLFTKGEGMMATAFTEGAIVYKSDRFLLLYLDKVDKALANAMRDVLIPAGYFNYMTVRMGEPRQYEPTQGWTGELQIRLTFYTGMGV